MLVTEQKKAYWEYQYRLGKEYIIPLLSDWGVSLSEKKVLDIGCAEGGVLCSFADLGVEGYGIELSSSRLLIAKEMARKHHIPTIHFIIADINQMPLQSNQKPFDFILLRDVFEHLIDKQKIMSKLNSIMGDKTTLLITFPPFYAPFGGHQQLLSSWLKRVPYFHVLPFPFWSVFRWYIKQFDKNSGYLNEVEKLRSHRITIDRFWNLAKVHGFKVVKKRYYITRPSYRLRFGWPVIISNRLARIPIMREFVISGAFFLLEKDTVAS